MYDDISKEAFLGSVWHQCCVLVCISVTCISVKLVFTPSQMVCCAFCSPNMLFFPLTPLKVYGFSRDDFTSRHHGSSFVLTSTPLLSRRRSILSLDSLNYSSCPPLQEERDWMIKSVNSLQRWSCFGRCASLWSCQPQEQVSCEWPWRIFNTYLPCKSCCHLFIIKAFWI